MTETLITAHKLSAAWLALGKRAAVAAGALAALVALIHDAPLWVATLRGAAVWAAVLALAFAGRAWLARSVAGSEGRA